LLVVLKLREVIDFFLREWWLLVFCRISGVLGSVSSGKFLEHTAHLIVLKLREVIDFFLREWSIKGSSLAAFLFTFSLFR
jgi:hypothetical protein